MRPLIAVINCHSRPEFQKCVRETWLLRAPNTVDVRFFLGRGADRDQLPDEVFLDCDDSYEGLPGKVQCMFKWALDNNYDFAMKLDDDTVLKPQEWLRSGFDQYDFTGPRNGSSVLGGVQTSYGFSYVCSRKAMQVVVDSPLPENNNDEYWCSLMLHNNGIVLHHDPRYFLFMGARTQMVQMCAPNRPLRRFVDPPHKEPIPGSFAFCIYLNWQGWHVTPSSEVISEFKRIFVENLNN